MGPPAVIIPSSPIPIQSTPTPISPTPILRLREEDGTPIPLASLSEGNNSSSEDDSSEESTAAPPQPVAVRRAKSVAAQNTAPRAKRHRKSVQTLAALNPKSIWVYDY